MYSNQEVSGLRQDFWTAFGQYMSLHLSVEGEKINWINYKTGIKHVYFKLYATNTVARIAIELTHSETGIRHQFYDQFVQSKKAMEQILGEQWIWLNDATGENGKAISRIYVELPSVNVLNKAHWPAIISFFKPRLLALDDFWCLSKYNFQLF